MIRGVWCDISLTCAGILLIRTTENLVTIIQTKKGGEKKDFIIQENTDRTASAGLFAR